jgi:hypothetical protein
MNPPVHHPHAAATEDGFDPVWARVAHAVFGAQLAPGSRRLSHCSRGEL